jgi:tetratricopeptide (TPR) repeat protein
MPNKARIAVPGIQGALEFDPGPSPWQSQQRPDGTVVLQAMARADHLLVTAFLQRVNFAASAEKCRDARWPNAENALRSHKARLDDLQKTTQEGMAKVEFMLQEVQGEKLQMKDVHAYLGSGDLCAEVHLSKVDYVPDDRKLFDDVLATVRLHTDDSGAQEQAQASQATEYLGQASRFYIQHNYPAAAERYQKALDLEKQKRTLNKTMFRVLVDNLGMSYGISGNLPKAKETFEYGITQDPEYPLFYYNMACTFGEMGKMDEALEQLRLAYKYKANVIAGESLPDPMKDDSFRKFVNDKKFVDAVQQMAQP